MADAALAEEIATDRKPSQVGIAEANRKAA
jgi:hypothetical protein